ncbi:hypothetical protein Golomagni_06680, partial [Golovinomyces magnicellulatus]
SESVVHPRSRFESSQGSILVGRRCIIQERAHIGAPGESEDASNTGGVVLGDYVQVEVGVVVETGGTEVGEGTLIQVGSKVGSGAKVGKHCTISPLTVVAPGEELPDFTTVFSNGTRRTDRRDASDIRKHGIVKQIGVLRHMIPSNPDKTRVVLQNYEITTSGEEQSRKDGLAALAQLGAHWTGLEQALVHELEGWYLRRAHQCARYQNRDP